MPTTNENSPPELDPSGKVFLVGAGPGDPELITVRGLKALRRADVVVYDRLVHPALVAEAPPWADRRFAGKAPGLEAMTQGQINAFLIERARRGLAVVRLKGGDPFVFGRGGEEAAALENAGIPWEVVPAASSSLAAPALAGIPVTHRGVAANFAVVTGHRIVGADAPDWRALAALDTLVILMGVGRLPAIARELMAAGRDPQTPAAIVERGSLKEERVIAAPLAEIAEEARRSKVRPPATIVIGEVVGHRLTPERPVPLADTREFPLPLAGEDVLGHDRLNALRGASDDVQ